VAVTEAIPQETLGMMIGRGLHSSTFRLNLSRFGHTFRVPVFDRLRENRATNVSHKMCLR